MDRPTGEGQTSRADREKWDAWHGQGGLEKTEAKRRYIETLVETMKRYASQTPYVYIPSPLPIENHEVI